jgi:16S rRNA (adenine1518-N6/adenine1519-N6)-dimethyltransferase
VVSVGARGGRSRRGPLSSRRQRWLGQNFLADPNLLEAIVRESGVGAEDVVLEVGGGEGALSEGLARLVRHLHVVELDEHLREPLEGLRAAHPNVSLVWGDAMRVDLGALEPSPSAMVSNLPYSIATPLLLRTIEELEGLRTWTVLVQREIAERLRAEPGTRAYGAPSVLVQLACEVDVLRTVDRAVFVPRPRVDSALLRLRRIGAAAPGPVRELVRGAFAHRRKALAGSLELAGVALRADARRALACSALPADARAEALAPQDFVRLAEELSDPAASRSPQTRSEAGER